MGRSYQRKCKVCTEMIHMLECRDGLWRAFDFPNRTPSGSWEIHNHGGVL
jgi:hypothetical protein